MNIKALFVALILLFHTLSLFSQKFELAFNSGMGYRVFAISDSVTDSYAGYLKKKRPGNILGAEFIWFDSNQGFGLKYTGFFNRVSGSGLKLNALEKIDKTETIQIDYYSLQYHKRFWAQERKLFTDAAVGLGYVRYSSIGKELEEENVIKGTTYGLNATFSINYNLVRKLVVGVYADMFLANIKKYQQNGADRILNVGEGLTYINGGLLLRYCF
jgi:hypothetical protein